MSRMLRSLMVAASVLAAASLASSASLAAPPAPVKTAAPAPAAAPAVKQGDLVLAKWRDGNLYPARVAGTKGGKTKVAYYDGDVSVIANADVHVFSWKVGSRVECNWKRGGSYYKGKIAAKEGEAILIHYDDGDKEEAGIGRCRVKPMI